MNIKTNFEIGDTVFRLERKLEEKTEIISRKCDYCGGTGRMKTLDNIDKKCIACGSWNGIIDTNIRYNRFIHRSVRGIINGIRISFDNDDCDASIKYTLNNCTTYDDNGYKDYEEICESEIFLSEIACKDYCEKEKGNIKWDKIGGK